MSCERPCEKKCRKDCEKRQGGSGGTNAETCRIESKKVCDIKCGNLPKPGPCISKCVEEKAKVCAFLSQEEAQSEQACRLKCGRHLCVNNKCTCSIYYTGDPLCMTPTAVKDMLPPRYAHCATPYSDGRFGKREGKNVTILSDRSRSLDFVRNYHKEYMSSLGLAIKRDPDVKDLIDFSTCAVVGSSNTLLGSDLGPEIDSHSAIIRFNDAKTMGYQQDVGSQNQPQDPERHVLRVSREQKRGVCALHRMAREHVPSIERQKVQGHRAHHVLEAPGLCPELLAKEALPWIQGHLCGISRHTHRPPPLRDCGHLRIQPKERSLLAEEHKVKDSLCQQALVDSREGVHPDLHHSAWGQVSQLSCEYNRLFEMLSYIPTTDALFFLFGLFLTNPKGGEGTLTSVGARPSAGAA